MAPIKAANWDLAPAAATTGVREALTALVKLQVEEGRRAYEASNARYEITRRVTLGVTLVSGLLLIGCGVLVSRSIVLPVGD